MADDPGAIVYGAMLVATLLAAESPGGRYAETVEAVAVAVLGFWLATAYGAFTGERARAGETFSVGGLYAVLVHKLAVLLGGSVPLVAVLGCWAAGARLSTGVWVAVGSAIAMILGTELALGLRSEHTGRELVLRTGLGALLGVAILGIKLLLH